jgi:pimeloyl-ACP methyl ester carboxylesterase
VTLPAGATATGQDVAMPTPTAIDRFTTSDGIGLVYRRWGAPSDRPPVLLHHGFIANATLNWLDPGVVGALVADGREVVAHDARGHGDSDRPHDPALYGEARMSLDVSELADHLGFERFDLVGYSMGGVVASITGTREPRVRRLVIGGVGCAIVELGGVDTRVMDRDSLADGLEAAAAAEERTAAGTDGPTADGGPELDATAKGFRAFAKATGGDLRALAAQARSVHRTPIPVDTITAPTLVLVGESDPLASRPEVLSGAIPGARLEVVPGDHLGAVGVPRFREAIVEFLR